MTESVHQIGTHIPWWMQLPTYWPAQGDLMQWAQEMRPGTAAILVIGGIVYLAFGVYLFRLLVTLNAALVGAYVGSWIGARNDATLAGAMVGGFFFAALAWPLMKYAVAIMGAMYGALLGASIWRAVNLPPEFAWAGGMVGLVGFGLLSFILFRGSIMMYTSLQGSVMLVFGLLGLIFKYQEFGPRVIQSLSLQPFLLPILIFVPATLGLIYQQTQWGAVEGAKK